MFTKADNLFHAFMYHFNSKFDFETFVYELTAVLNQLENTGEISFEERKEYVKSFIADFEAGSGSWDAQLKQGVTQAMIYDIKCDNPCQPSSHTATIIRLAGSDELRRWVLSHR